MYFLPYNSRVSEFRRMRWAKHETRGFIVEMSYTYKILVVKPDRKRFLLIPKHRWDGNIKMGLEVTGCEGMDCIYLAQNTE